MNLIETQIADWNGEQVIVRHDRPSGAWIFIAIHSTRLGPAAGGTRMKSYADVPSALRDALRLSEGMTYKFAASGMHFGGAKAVIAVPPGLDSEARRALLQRYGKLVAQLGGLFRTGPDVGTTPPDMDVIATTGAPYIVSRTAEAGGAGDPGPYTALGVFTGIEVTAERVFGSPSLKGRRLLVQGVGDVGGSLVGLLRNAGAEVLFSEINESLVATFRDRQGLRMIESSAVYATDCDIFAPCALGAVLNAETIPQLRCRAVAGSANNQLEVPGDAERLRARGILYAPDYVVNAGGALAILGLELQDWSRERAEIEVVTTVRRNLERIFDAAAANGTDTEVAARAIAEQRLHASA